MEGEKVMKKLLAVMLSLVMVMSLFTGCGSSSDKNAEAKKESSTFFKELKKVAEIDKGTVSLEYNINLKGDEITNSTDIPAVMKSGDTISLALKADIVTESKDKVAAKISVKYGEQMDYTELTTIAVSGSKLYLNVGSLVEFAKSIDEEAAKQIEAALPQMGVTNDYASVDVDQFLKAAGVDETATTGNSDKLVAAVKAMMENMEKSFDKLQGQDGDDYTLTIGADNAEQVVDSIYNYIDGGFKTDVTAVIDGLAEALGNDSELASSFDEAKEEIQNLDVEKAKENKDDMIKQLKDSKLNIVTKLNVTGDKGSRKAKLSVETGDVENEGITMNIKYNCNIEEKDAKITDMIPGEDSVSDITSVLISLLNAYAGGSL